MEELKMQQVRSLILMLFLPQQLESLLKQTKSNQCSIIEIRLVLQKRLQGMILELVESRKYNECLLTSWTVVAAC